MDLMQRLPRAVLVTVLSALFLGGTTGLVVAAGEPEVPKRMATAEPHGGDRWQYEMEAHIEGMGMTETQRSVIAYEWLPAELLQAADGRWHTVQPLFEQMGFGAEAEWNAYLIDVATDQVVATRDRMNGEGSSLSRSMVGGVAVSESRTEERTEYLTTRFDPFPPFCGYRHAMQDGARDPARATFHGFCGMDLDHPEGMAFEGRFKPAGMEEASGLSALRLHRADPLGDDVDLDVDLWLAPHVPYPVQLRYGMAVDLGDMGHFELELTMVMTGFEPGRGDWGVPLSMPVTGVPTVLTAPVEAWGPDDTGIQHPFKLSDAWQVARQDMTAGEWLEDHPKAQVLSANFTRVEFDDRTELRWEIWVAERRDQVTMTITRTLRDDEPLHLVLGLAEDDEVVLRGSDRSLPDDMPASAPTIQSVQARWQSMRPDAGLPNAYGFWPSCACAEAHWKVSAGRVEAADSTPTIDNPADPAPTEFSEDRDTIIVGWRAQPEALQSTARRGSTYESGLVTLGPQAAPQDDAPALAALDMSSGIWGFPPAPAAASVVAGAFIVGLLYWLWPAIKTSGAVGLFSRVQKDELLEHPTRRSIHDAIQSNPGIHYQALIRTIGKGRGTVEHHVHKLQQGGYVVAHRNDGHTCFFVRGAMDHSVMAAVPAVRQPAAARVLAHIQAHPGLRIVDLGDALGLARSTASHHVKRLKEAGLVVAWADGGLSTTAIAAPALQAVAA